jgi:hypothetical protein
MAIMKIDIPLRIAIGGRLAAAARPPIDRRWPAVAAAIAHLRGARRRSLRIVDADCGDGTLLLQAVRYARALGFTAIEGRGIDGDPARVRAARAVAASLRDPAIGVTFECVDPELALAEEAEFPADILLWHGSAGRAGIASAVETAGHIVISGPPPLHKVAA